MEPWTPEGGSGLFCWNELAGIFHRSVNMGAYRFTQDLELALVRADEALALARGISTVLAEIEVCNCLWRRSRRIG